MNDERGSIWRKWDLHVHTPESIVHLYEGADPWPQFLDELEALPPEFKVIGVNDYIFLDGYRRILGEKASGRLKNIDLFLPVIELRLDRFGGSNHRLSRVNYHVIFSNELHPDVIEQQFLNALSSKYILSPQHQAIHSSGQWVALPTRQSITDLGERIIASVPATERQHFGSPLIEGFNNLTLNLDAITEALKSHYFKGRFITAVGKTEWADIKWNDHSIADKKNIINGADLVFISSPTVEQWQQAKTSLANGGVNARLLDCSDAHAFVASGNKDRLGQCLTWIKADPTFEGLLQILVEPDERIWVGDLPPQLARVRSSPTKYLESIRIKRRATATASEMWFDNYIPLNPGLVAIIGNKGKGKSALTDIIGLLSNTKQHKDFTFLSQDNFRQPRDNKARNFQATISLCSQTSITRGLEELVDEKQPELVKYIPQGFLEKICTQLGKIEESDFDRELKKVIFSHVDVPKRLGKSSLDELIDYKTTEATQQSEMLKLELHKINQQIIALEEKAELTYLKTVENLLERKNKELAAHELSKPVVVTKPENDPARQKVMFDTAEAIALAKKDVSAKEADIKIASDKQSILTQQVAIVEKLSGRLDLLSRQFRTFVTENQADFTGIDLALDTVVSMTINKTPLSEKRTLVEEEQKAVEIRLDATRSGSIAQKKAELEARIKRLENDLDEPNRKYQAYEDALKAWEAGRATIIGDASTLDTIAYYRAELDDLKAVPERLNEAHNGRIEKSREIHGVIKQLADAYRELYAPVNRFIEAGTLAREKFQLNFEVGIVDAGFLDEFFDLVSQGSAGTFCGVEQGSKALKDLLARQDFNTSAGVEAFLREITVALQVDQRPAGKGIVVRTVDQLRKGKTPSSLYDFIFSLGYLTPRYALRMGRKELSELSPGERGTLLLVFYLLVDKDDIPLVIDQPEENLDNQTIFELLVPCMKEAKRRRQLFIVTHNPNLAVVCDAEQIVSANLDKANNYKMTYLSGAIENPKVNRAIVDVLEGTMPAFHNRQDKYFSSES